MKDEINEWFDDVFSEFIEILNQTDLSQRTIVYLEDIFEKDKKYFIKSIAKNYDFKKKEDEKKDELSKETE